MKYKIAQFALLSLYSVVSWAGINAADGVYVGGDLTLSYYENAQGAASDNAYYIPGLMLTHYISFRPYIGYHFNDFFAIEGGYLNLANDHSSGGDEYLFWIEGPNRYRLYSVDLAPKFIYPFHNGFSVYAKVGVAYVHQNVYNQPVANEPATVDSNVNKIRPLIGCGISYNFTQQFATDFTFTHIAGTAPIHSINSVGLGLSYTF